MTNKDKIMDYLEDRPKDWIDNDTLSHKTGIDKSNLSKLLKILENENAIERKYDQIGKAKYVFVRLKKYITNSIHNETISDTNSIPIEPKITITPIKHRIRPAFKTTISKKSIIEIKRDILNHCKKGELAEHKRFIEILTKKGGNPSFQNKIITEFLHILREMQLI